MQWVGNKAVWSVGGNRGGEGQSSLELEMIAQDLDVFPA